jgi:TonB-linked SusC/RagA family outer membrane protein
MKKKRTKDHPDIFRLIRKGLLIMKLSLLLIVVGVLQSAASVYSQTWRINLKESSMTVKEVLSLIESTSEFRFFYEEKKIDVEKKISIDVSNAIITEVLGQLFDKEGVEYKIFNNNYIVLKPNGENSVFTMEFSQQQKSISGKVTDSSGASLPGVSVVVKGTTIGTITDTNGNYSLPNVAENATLQFSFVGMKGQEVAVSGKSTIDVTLVEDAIGIEEVVAVGYGTMQKKDITGSVSQIKSDEIRQINATSVGEALQGKLPANIVQSWAPGASPSIEIRGISSMTGSNDPLWVVDGVPMQSGNVYINPNDIESIDVLKDASATAIYGARGSNGVILVTTKSFDPSKAGVKVSYDGWVGIEKVAKSSIPELFNAEEYSNYRRLAAKNGNRPTDDTQIFDALELESMKLGRSTDWFDLAWGGSAVSTNHNVSFNASTPISGTFVSLGYLNENSVINTADFTRYNVKFNNTLNLSRKVKIASSFLVDHSIRNGFFNLFSAFYLSPNGYPYDETGKVKLYANPNEALHTNPLAEIQNNKNENKRYGIIGNSSLEWEIISGLKYKLFVGADYSSVRLGNYVGSETMARSRAPFVSRFTGSNTISTIVDNVLSYKKAFGDHKIDALAAFNNETYTYENVFLEGTDMDYDGLWYNLGAASTITNKGSELSKWGIISYMGRANYSFMDKYLFTFTYRYDGSSRLAEGEKWAGFPSLAIGWRLSEEKFIKNLGFVDNLKMRLTWGSSGNTNVDPYETLGQLGKTFYDWDNTPAIGYAPSVIPNPELRWERTEETNLGFDFGFLGNRINGSVDIYDRTTRDLMLSRNLPITSGFSNITQNIGSVKNTGVEIALGGQIIKKKDFSWDVNLMFAKNNNEILDLYGDKKDDVGSKWFIGQPIRVDYKLDFIGVWQLGEEAEAAKFGAKPGYIKYRDVTPNSAISLADDRIIIPLDPKWVGGLSSGVRYKGFNLNFNLNTRQGVKGYSQIHDTQDEATGRYNQIKISYWTVDNPSNEAPTADASGASSKEIRNSDYYIRDLSFVRLSNINLGYQLPASSTRKLDIESVKVYLNVKNPYLWTDYDGMDPENGTNTRNHPSLTSYQLGLNINF